MLTTLLVLVACAAGEPTTSTDSGNLPDDSKTLFVSPRLITLEGAQGVRFAAYESLIPGSAEVTAIEWTTTGGSVAADGSYASGGEGEYKVIGKKRGGPHNPPADTAVVIVVPPQPTVIGLEVMPTDESTATGTMVQFSVLGWMSDSSQVAVGVTWTATGGTIDAGGMYKAGSTAGTYKVVATHVSTGKADTVNIDVTPAVLSSIQLNPRSVSLGTGMRQQFSVSGGMSDGSTTAPAGVVYSVTGGTITSAGLYSAPSSGGNFTVTAKLANINGSTLSSNAAVSVASAAVAPVAGMPHLPADYVRIAEHSFAGLPANGTGTIAGGWYNTTSSHITIISDGTAPVSQSSALQFRFPAGLPVGNGVGLINGWETTGSTPPDKREFYESGWFKIPTADFETPGPGMKLLGYWGVGQRGSKVPSQIYTVIRGNGDNTSLMSNWALDIRQQGNVNRSMSQNRSTKRIRAGMWHRYEVQMILNNVDQSNGVLRFWLDNGDGGGLSLTHEYTDVKFRTSAANSADGIDSQSGFYGRRWDPIWGGMGGNAKSRADYLWVDHIFIAGKPM